jgi:hypothetical protein
MTSLQILARALGGSVGPNPDGNFVLTIEQIQPTQQLQQFTQLHSAVQQALAAEAARGGSSSVAATDAARCGADVDALQQDPAAAAAAAAAVDPNDDGAVSVLDALESMSIASLANNNSSSNDNTSSDSAAGTAAAAVAAVGSRAAVAAADGGCFRLIESHGDQVGVSTWSVSNCYTSLL